MTAGGRLISEEDWDFIFMPPLLNGMNIPNNDSLLKEYLHSTPLKMEVPIPFFDWTCFFGQCKEFMGPNFFQFVLFLSGGLSAFHYQRVLEVVGKDDFFFQLRALLSPPELGISSSELFTMQHFYTSYTLTVAISTIKYQEQIMKLKLHEPLRQVQFQLFEQLTSAN